MLCACADQGDQDAWEECVLRFHKPIFGAIFRTGSKYRRFRKDDCHDLVQQTYVKLNADNAKALRVFVPRGPGSAVSYVCVVAMRVTHDFCKSAYFQRTEEWSPDHEVAAPSNAAAMVEQGAVESVLKKHASERDRLIFGFWRQGFSAREISRLPGIDLSESGVESAILRLRRLLKEKFGEGEREEPG